tara:strand:- start:574 stop:837 length:264 start_codon:yes stop_codon:yes gene_type:complete
MADPTINDKSHFKISLPMALQALGLIGVLVFGYRDLESRIRLLEHEQEKNSNAIKDIVDMQEKPIPSDIRQDTKLEYIEKELDRLKQ